MKNKLLLRINLLLCAVLAAAIVSASAFVYQSSIGKFKNYIERIANLTSENIYSQGSAYFDQRIGISMAMANDAMLKRFLTEEADEPDGAYLAQIQEYLSGFKEKYGYASTFLVSAKTGRYYHFSGQNRILARSDPENGWYFDLMDSGAEYSFDAGKDKYEGEMYFVDCKIYSGGQVLGIAGVGFRLDGLSELMRRYNDEHEVAAILIGSDASEMSYGESTPMFSEFEYLNEASIKDVIAETGTDRRAFWGDGRYGDCYMVARYVPSIECYLIVENNISKLREPFERRLFIGVGAAALIVLSVLMVFNRVILSYNERALKLLVAQEMEYHTLLSDAIKELYMDVYEFDVTRGIPAGEYTQGYFERMGISGGSRFRDAMKTVTETQIKKEFQEGFAAVFSQENVLKAFAGGIRELNYDCIVITAEKGEKWVRMRARLFYYNSDKSVHMIVFSQDIDAEKERESRLLSMAESDPLTGFYNKAATKEHISRTLAETEAGAVCAFVIIDIDYFKGVNDTLGHAAGDHVIKDFSVRLKRQFRETDIYGRIGGDEFVVLLRDIPGEEWLAKKMNKLTASLRWEISGNRRRTDNRAVTRAVSASIGIACYPQAGTDFDTLYQNADAALYAVKEKGRNGFSVYA